MTSPCGCRVEVVEGPDTIRTAILYCPLHLAAEEMLAALRHGLDAHVQASPTLMWAFARDANDILTRIARAEGRE